MYLGTLEDFDIVRTMSLKFLDSIEYKEHSDLVTIDTVIASLLSSSREEGGILVEDKGFLAYRRVPFIFNTNKNIGTEVAWWVEPEARKNGLGLDLLQGYEYWARNFGDCFAVTMSCFDELTGKFLEKNGYKLYERAYMKVF